MLSRGDTFINDARGDLLSHLWIVLSDPTRDPNQVVIVNVTTWKDYHDQTCILDVGDHPFVRHRSCLNYAEARLAEASQLRKLTDAGHLSPHRSLDPDLLERISRGALESDRTPIGCAEVLRSQTDEE